jgi:hypothetical protein
MSSHEPRAHLRHLRLLFLLHRSLQSSYFSSHGSLRTPTFFQEEVVYLYRQWCRFDRATLETATAIDIQVVYGGYFLLFLTTKKKTCRTRFWLRPSLEPFRPGAGTDCQYGYHPAGACPVGALIGGYWKVRVRLFFSQIIVRNL